MTFMNYQKETIHILVQQKVLSPSMELLLGRGVCERSQSSVFQEKGPGSAPHLPGPLFPHLEAAEHGGRNQRDLGLSPAPPARAQP